MAKNIIKTKNKTSIGIMAVALFAAVVLNINAALIIILCGIFGGIYYNFVEKAGEGQ
jgi:chromate transport protein ChrA